MGLEIARAFITVRGDTGRLAGDLGKVKTPVAAKMGAIGMMDGKAFAGAMAIAGVGSVRFARQRLLGLRGASPDGTWVRCGRRAGTSPARHG